MMGTILRVNLNTGNIKTESAEPYSKWIGGFGAVMGSKNLKAVVADGTRDSVTTYDAMEMAEAYRPDQLVKKYRIRQSSCAGCFVGCQNGHRIPEGPYAGVEMEGAPFNSVLNFGTKLDIADYGFYIEATWLCNNLGMDMDSVAELLGWAMECYENGIITSQELDGLELCFGNQEADHELILKIAERDGVGDLLAEGVARAATCFSEKAAYYAIHQKGNDLYEIIRPLIGYGLGAATSTRGGSHVLGSPVCESGVFHEEERKLAIRKFGVTTFNDARAYEGKPEIVIFGCTSGSFLSDGDDGHNLREEIEALCKCPVITASDAMIDALKALNTKKLTLVTPYTDDINEKEKAFIESNGIEVVSMTGLGITSPEELRTQSVETTENLVLTTDVPEADTVFISCTNLEGFHICDALEKKVHKPVFSSNLACLWSMLKQIDNSIVINNRGTLFKSVDV